jgi:putative FmdB family regulatory protein
LPTYEYACTACGHRLEAVQSFSDDPLTECPECGAALRKVYGNVGIVFKGSGFYKTDSRNGSNGNGKSSSSDTSGSDSAGGGSDTSTKTDSSTKSDSSSKSESSSPSSGDSSSKKDSGGDKSKKDSKSTAATTSS